MRLTRKLIIICEICLDMFGQGLDCTWPATGVSLDYALTMLMLGLCLHFGLDCMLELCLDYARIMLGL